jgi:uncharacterized membrane protein YoaK (UPF0700 family)
MQSPPDKFETTRKLSLIHGSETHPVESALRLPSQAVNNSFAKRVLPILLGSIAGSTDTIGFLALGGLFTAHITGNFVVLAAHLVSHSEVSAAVILAVPVFVTMLLVARWLAAGLEALGIDPLQPLLLVQCLLLAGFLAIRVGSGDSFHLNAPTAILAGMLGVAAMAVQNAVGQISLGAPSTTAMTANVVRSTLGFGEIFVRSNRDQNWWRGCLDRDGPLAGFVIGCGLGAACEAEFARWALALPLALAAGAFAMSLAPSSETRRKLRTSQ